MKILVVDDDWAVRESVLSILELEGMQVCSAENGHAAKRLLEQESVEAVISDYKMPGMDGMALLQWIQQEGPSVPVLMMSAYGDISEAVSAMKLGAKDYLVKPFDPEEFVIRVRRVIENHRLHAHVESGRREFEQLEDWIGESPRMRELKAMVEKIAPTPSTVLITGESGTGKELIAKSLHRLSPRFAHPFVAINIAGVPENLLESELFGHEKGAFTGADSRKLGMFELASSGTLFLDEIGDMPLQLQVKLLRVLQERKIQRLGGTQSLPIDVRILAATNQDLQALMAKRAFREDVFYRVNVIRLEVPPLRERAEDIPLLAGYFLKKFNARLGKTIQGIQPEALRALQNYTFSGNVRELENILERAIILAESETLSLKDLNLVPASSAPVAPRGTLEAVQKLMIREALQRWEGNRTKAAAELGINRRTLLRKIKEYHFEDV